MTQRAYLIGILFCIGLITGCSSSPTTDAYRLQQPGLDLFSFFTGTVDAWGVVQNRNGEVIQRFTVTIEGTVKDNMLQLDEQFSYQLGEGPTQRTWQIEDLGEGRYRGRAADILDDATGQSLGNAFRWQYRMDLPVDDSSYVVDFDDWFWALDDKSLLNRSTIRKFGISFAEVTLFMQRR